MKKVQKNKGFTDVYKSVYKKTCLQNFYKHFNPCSQQGTKKTGFFNPVQINMNPVPGYNL